MERKNLKPFIKKIYSISSKIHQIRSMDIPLKMGIRVNSASLSTLTVIDQNPDLKMSEISQKMGLTKGAVSQVGLKLQQKGLIKKSKTEGNAKNIFMEVTDQGKQALSEYEMLHDALYDGMFELLSHYQEDEVELICKFLQNTDQFLTDYKIDMERELNSELDEVSDCPFRVED